MPDIQLLTQETIDKIAAGEVVERPSSVVKELVENAIDAGSSAITVEIKDGGTTFIRITDNGCGIDKNQVKLAFLRHSTSKIRSVEDLIGVTSLGFRGEALSSISAVARVELITKTGAQLTGTRYCIEGSKEICFEEVGAPDGTTFLIRDLFFNTPARKKFLKSPQTEGNYISEIVEKLALSHPDISFKYIQNNQTKLHTSGNGSRKDLIYHIYGREITQALIPVDFETEHFKVEGFLAKPQVTRGNRNLENYFINGRYVRSKLIAKSIEDAYKKFLMQHQYPFTVLYFQFRSPVDVNVHPSKMELRFGDNQQVYSELYTGLYNVLTRREMIPQVPVDEKAAKEEKKPEYKENVPEPFEKRRINEIRAQIAKDSPYEIKYPQHERRTFDPNAGFNKGKVSEDNSPAAKTDTLATENAGKPVVVTLHKKTVVPAEVQTGKSEFSLQSPEKTKEETGAGQTYDPLEFLAAFGKQKTDQASLAPAVAENTGYGTQKVAEETEAASNKPEKAAAPQAPAEPEIYEQTTLEALSSEFLTKDARRRHRIIGQLFATYWLVEFEDKLFIIDQHAAHEKVLYERTMKTLAEKDFTSQVISPPIVMTLDAQEASMLEKYRSYIEKLGYEVEHFGGKEYMISAVPANLYSIDTQSLFIEMLDEFNELSGRQTPDLILEKVASMSCKAAVKGNDKLSMPEIEALFDELLELDNPYNCPHGRPTIISMTKYEIEKKFKRIV